MGHAVTGERDSDGPVQASPAAAQPSGEPIAHGTCPPASTSPRPAPGTRIGQYEIIRELGRGGMGAVYAARDTKLARKVAIKLLNGNNQPELTARFVIEAKATARCSHENIIVIHEVGEHDGNPFMVLEYLQGAPLTQRLRDGKRFPPAQAIELMVPVVRALTVAHAHNIVHRDLKPDNIFVTDSGTIKVLDFGIAKLIHGDPDEGSGCTSGAPSRVFDVVTGIPTPAIPRELTRRGTLVGTLPYMSPEQWGGGGAVVDHQTDVWAVGIILFEMVAGRHPLFPLRNRDLKITGFVREPMPSVRGACPNLPDELADIIDRCLLKRKDHRMATARDLLDALEPLLPGRYTRRLRSDESPYAGLESFQESDAHRFFGRARDVAAAVAKLRDAPLLGIVGASGVGKSSFVRAGIVPALKASGEAWSTVVVRPGRSPMTALAHALAPMLTTGTGTDTTVSTVSDDLSQQHEVVERLHAEPGFLGAALRSRARSRGQNILLFVDQFEELYTQVADPRERRAFTACLAGVCDDTTTPLRLVVALRSDFVDRVAEDPALLDELTRGLFVLAPPSRDGLRDALVQPAELAGYQFEHADVVESMLDHVEHSPGALPLLQFAASQLWEMRDSEQRRLTVDSYHRIGGIAGALASHADAVVAECNQREQSLVRALFLRLVTPERTRALAPVAELYELSPDPAEIDRLVDRLVRSRLLVSPTTGAESGGTAAGTTVELVHESLINSWPLLRRWLDENQEDAAFLEQLRSAAKQWQTKGHAPGLLWRGEAADEARHWHGRYRGEIPELQRAYLNAVFALAARPTRRTRLAVIAAMVLLSAAVIAAGVGLFMIRKAQEEAAARAQRAEHQLTLTQVAEKAADAERARTVAANQKLESQNAALVAASKAADRARIEAERAAREAEAEAGLAGERLQTLLDQAKRRVQKLEEFTRGVKVIPDVPVN